MNTTKQGQDQNSPKTVVVTGDDQDEGDVVAQSGSSTQSTDQHSTISNLVKDADLKQVIGIAAAALLLLVAFGVAIFSSGLIDFPDMTDQTRASSIENYYMDALAYRERRVGLALILRTFLTGFSFVVGLALCTMGGIFILRQVKSLTNISGGFNNPQDPINLGDDAKKVARAQFAFEAYSPGVVFLAGGVLIMVVTQYFAIEIQTIEVSPPIATEWCINKQTGNIEICAGERSTRPARTPAATEDALTQYCIENPDDSICAEAEDQS